MPSLHSRDEYRWEQGEEGLFCAECECPLITENEVLEGVCEDCWWKLYGDGEDEDTCV